ncbi:MAG: helix-turn-helix domain-containing protein, partial [Proteobacteria bacterium]|nr:helix-turn-helix domain-containing protein [Pseudomonadota bacterium]
MKSYLEAKNAKELCKLLKISLTEAPRIEMRTQLVVAIKRAIQRGKLTQAQAATKAGVGRTVITAIVNGNLESISTDRLIDVAHSLG